MPGFGTSKAQAGIPRGGLDGRDLIKEVLKIGKFVEVTRKANVVTEHPADDKFIECALSAHADYIVSGDRHLLKVARYEKIHMLSVRELLGLLEAGKN